MSLSGRKLSRNTEPNSSNATTFHRWQNAAIASIGSKIATFGNVFSPSTAISGGVYRPPPAVPTLTGVARRSYIPAHAKLVVPNHHHGRARASLGLRRRGA